MRTPGYRTNKSLWLALGLCVGAALSHPLPAHAALDLLKTPARASAMAPRSTMLAVTITGIRLVAAGERGLIIFSDDGGTNWQQASVPVSVTLTALHFASRDAGWATGHDGVILNTTDGGKTWRKQFDGNQANALINAELESAIAKRQEKTLKPDPAKRGKPQAELESLQLQLEDAKAGAEFGPSRPLLALYFLNEHEGFAAGSFGQLFHTADGGRNWTSWGLRIDNPNGLHYNGIARLSDGSLMISGEAGKLRRSRDNGQTWETLDTGYAGHLYGTLAIPGTPVLLAHGFAGNVVRSPDGGKTWNALGRQIDKSLIAGGVLPNGAVLLLGSNRQILISRDQGLHFELAKSPTGRPASGAYLPQAGPMAIAGAGGVAVLPISPLLAKTP